MKLLIIVPYVPNLIRVRPYQIIRALHRQQHEITLATVWTSEDERADLDALASLGITVVAEHLTKTRSLWNIVRTIPSGRPLQAEFCWHPHLAKRLEALITEAGSSAGTGFDAVHVEHLRGALYGLHVKQILDARETKGARHVPVVWDSVDCISHLFGQAASQSRSLKGRLMARLDLKRTQLFEGFLVNQFEHVVTTSTTDADALARLAVTHSCTELNPADLVMPNGRGASNKRGAPNERNEGMQAAKISAIPNGVDLDYFEPITPIPIESEPPTIVFSGKMSYHANVTAALYLVNKIMPIVWAKRPDVLAQVVGKDPAPKIRGLVEKSADPITNMPRIVVTGTVPDLRPYLTGATVSVAPVPYGAGIQNKVLEAMACGAPMIASAQAASGVAAKVGMDLLVARSAQGFGDAILTLLADPELRASLGKAGRRYVEAHHSWDGVAEKLLGIYKFKAIAQLDGGL